MFTEDEIQLMKKIGLDCDFNSLSDEDDYWAAIEEKVGDHLILHCLDKDYDPDPDGLLCKSILDKLP